MYRNSQRMVQSGMADLFGISMSLGRSTNLGLKLVKPLRIVCMKPSSTSSNKLVWGDETGFHQEISTVAIPKNVKLGYIAVTP